MGQTDGAKYERKARTSKTSEKRISRNTGEPADWGSIAPNAILAAIQAITLTGGAVRFGYTSDGGAYALGIYGDGEPYTEYFRPGENVEGYLYELAEHWR